LRQLNFNEIKVTSCNFDMPTVQLESRGNNVLPQDPQMSHDVTIAVNMTTIHEVPCSVCGYVNIPGLVICWRCGECLDPRIKKLAEGSP